MPHDLDLAVSSFKIAISLKIWTQDPEKKALSPTMVPIRLFIPTQCSMSLKTLSHASSKPRIT